MGGADDYTAREARLITLHTVDWIDIFIRPVYKQVIVHSLNHFIESKGLVVYAWCLMTHHLHLLGRSQSTPLADLEDQYRSFTTEKIMDAIDTEPPGRKEWMMTHFKNYNLFGLGKKTQVWESGKGQAAGIAMKKTALLPEHIEYVHREPVRDRIVEAPAEYLYSSARDYTGMKGLVAVTKPPFAEQQLAAAGFINGNFQVRYIRN